MKISPDTNTSSSPTPDIPEFFLLLARGAYGACGIKAFTKGLRLLPLNLLKEAHTAVWREYLKALEEPEHSPTSFATGLEQDLPTN